MSDAYPSINKQYSLFEQLLRQCTLMGKCDELENSSSKFLHPRVDINTLYHPISHPSGHLLNTDDQHDRPYLWFRCISQS